MMIVVIKIIIILAGTFLCLFIISSCSFSEKACRRLYEKASKEQFELVIVPGAPFVNGKWGRIMKGRIYWAKFLYDKGIAKNVMFSGAAVYTPYTEAAIMSMYAQAIGIPKKNIFEETKAEHSTENIYYSWQMATQLGFKKMALASDPFQTKMLQRFTRKKVDRGVQLIPFVVDSLKEMQPNMSDPLINYQAAFVPGFKPITKRENFWKRLKGTLGKNIDKNAHFNTQPVE